MKYPNEPGRNSLDFFLAMAVMCCCVSGINPPAAAESGPPPDTITDQELKTASEDLEAVYQRHLGRPPDPGAQRYYTDKIIHEGWDIYLVEQDLLTSREHTILNATQASAPLSGRGMVTLKSGLPLRDGPGIEHGCVKMLPNGAVVSIEEEMDGWYKVKYRDIDYWVYGKLLTPLEEILGAPLETELETTPTASAEPAVESPSSTDTAGKEVPAAVQWGRDQLNAFSATDTNSNTGKSVLMDPAAWDYWSQAFVSAAYGRAVPELEAPSPIQSYREFMKTGAIISEGNPPAGAVVFFDTNEPFPRGHVALSAGEPAGGGETAIISSGWQGKSGVFELPLHELKQQCGQYLGYGLVP